ncbi:MAG: aminotransferase class V-fold PLP-dependent enzyme, partial [Rickettsiales bacterium]|nr:aminotransferase class V-fold PLP-dependent enzyme [Rickettsiales bacterium]
SVSAFPAEILFTATGTEANATALCGIPGRRVLVSAVEHSSVLKAANAEIIPVDANGVIRLSVLDEMLRGTPPALVSLMLANNETGVIQPVKEAAEIAHAHGALLHCDAVQALSKIPVEFAGLGADMMSLSAHKCGGPLGAAALVLKRDIPIVSLLRGGGQELGRRAGTENVAAIAGFAAAIEKTAGQPHIKQARHWLDVMEASMVASGAVVFGSSLPRLPNTTCVAMPGISGEVQLMNFDLAGFAVSAGSACSSGRIEPSHVLTAMGVDKATAGSAIRVSGGWNTTQKEIQDFTQAWLALRQRLAA